MAEMIPESVPSGRPIGERHVFDVLQNLPDDYIVYYEPVIAHRYPDFLVICPDLGLMVVEVKDWLGQNITAADPDTVHYRFGNDVQPLKHPIRQAREYMTKLMDRCKVSRAHECLCHQEGIHKGQFMFPFGHMVILTKISSEELASHRLTEVFPSDRVMTKDGLEAWKTLSKDRLRQEMSKFFYPHNWSFPRLNGEQIKHLRAIIHPEIVITPVFDYQESGLVPHLKVLDQRQETIARKIGDGHRVINGVAGSGKTVLLIHRARWLSAEDSSRRILVMCRNRSLRAYLDRALKGCRNVKVSTFHKWGTSLGASMRFKDDIFGENLLTKVEGLKDSEKYDAILIDEAQDFDPSWFRCIVQALKDPEDGDLIAVADGNQGLYKPNSFRWKDVGIKATGRVIPLYQNYRNTQAIMDLAWPFAEQAEEDTREAIVSLKPVKAIRKGPKPLIERLANRSEETQFIISLVCNLLKGKWGDKQLETALLPSEIGIIYPRLPEALKKEFKTFKGLLKKSANVPVVWLTDPEDKTAKERIDQPGIKIQTIASSKGLQYRAAILMWADLLPIKGKPDQEPEQRRELYVGLTRAEDYLCVTYSGESKFAKQLNESWTRTFTL